MQRLTVAVINSTALAAKINSIPRVPPDDQWTSIPKYDLVYYKFADESSKQIIELNGALPVSHTITGLEKYTLYVFYLHFYGKLEATKEHNIISSERRMRTAEDGRL